jgi:cytochrome P450
VQPISLAGYDLPAGITVMPSIGLVQDGDAFADAEAFRPERFLDETGPAPYTWIPFGGGRRRCLGAAFASLEMRTVLKRVLSQVELSAPSARAEWSLPQHITLVPARGARLTSRPSGASGRPGP